MSKTRCRSSACLGKLKRMEERILFQAIFTNSRMAANDGDREAYTASRPDFVIYRTHTLQNESHTFRSFRLALSRISDVNER